MAMHSVSFVALDYSGVKRFNAHVYMTDDLWWAVVSENGTTYRETRAQAFLTEDEAVAHLTERLDGFQRYNTKHVAV
jgi:hypothetical protein